MRRRRTEAERQCRIGSRFLHIEPRRRLCLPMRHVVAPARPTLVPAGKPLGCPIYSGARPVQSRHFAQPSGITTAWVCSWEARGLRSTRSGLLAWPPQVSLRSKKAGPTQVLPTEARLQATNSSILAANELWSRARGRAGIPGFPGLARSRPRYPGPQSGTAVRSARWPQLAHSSTASLCSECALYSPCSFLQAGPSVCSVPLRPVRGCGSPAASAGPAAQARHHGVIHRRSPSSASSAPKQPTSLFPGSVSHNDLNCLATCRAAGMGGPVGKPLVRALAATVNLVDSAGSTAAGARRLPSRRLHAYCTFVGCLSPP